MGRWISKCLKPSVLSDSIDLEIVETNNPTSLRPVRIVQNFILLWLDLNMNEDDFDVKNSLLQLRQIVNTINTFSDPDLCMNFLSQIKTEKAFILISGSLSQSVIPRIHQITQLDSIYIFCINTSKYKQWLLEWSKVKGVFNEIKSICDALKRDTQQCNQDSITISVTSKDVDRLEPSFMYTQLLKEILLDMEYDEKAKMELVVFCRQQFHNNPHELKIIDDFERDYHLHTPIWWYTCECFTYQLLNRALRIQDVEVILKMGFFLRDVHRHLEKLHSHIDKNNLINVYRGKGMPNDDFDEIRNKKDGLLAFNTFLSTSLDEIVSLQFAKKSLKKPGTVGVLFHITVDPSISTTPFAPIKEVSAIPAEEEILFSMHTVFRIGEIEQIEDRVWRVRLSLTNDNDQDLKQLTEYIRKETLKSTKWEQLGHLLIKMGNFDKAEEIFHVLLKETFHDDEKMHASFYFHLGDIKFSTGNYKEALELYMKSLEIRQKYPHSKPSNLINTYNSIGRTHDIMTNYSKALEFYQKSFELGKTILPSEQNLMVETCSYIAAAYNHLGEYAKALEFYEKSREICMQSLSKDHSDLATVNNNMGDIHYRIQEYSKAIHAYEKTLEIQQKILPPNHPDLALIYNSIGLLHCNMGQLSKALDAFQTELGIKQKSLPSNHPSFSTTYNNIGLVYSNMGDFPKGLEYYQKSLEVSLKSLPANHPDLSIMYNNISLLHTTMGNIPKAIEFMEKSVEIKQATVSANEPDLFAAYSNIGLLYWNIGEYAKALPFYERALKLAQHTLPPHDPVMGHLLNSIALVHMNLTNHSKALEFFEKTLEIRKIILPADHPDTANTYNHIGVMYWIMGEYSKALPYSGQAVEIGRRVLPQNHPYLHGYENSLAQVQIICIVQNILQEIVTNIETSTH